MSKKFKDDETDSAAPAPAVPAPIVGPYLSFDRYFAATGKPPHHKSGMLAFLKGNTGGKRSLQEWNKVFEGY